MLTTDSLARAILSLARLHSRANERADPSPRVEGKTGAVAHVFPRDAFTHLVTNGARSRFPAWKARSRAQVYVRCAGESFFAGGFHRYGRCDATAARCVLPPRFRLTDAEIRDSRCCTPRFIPRVNSCREIGRHRRRHDNFL